MQDHSEAWDQALTGSYTPVVQVDAWYDGELVAEDVPGITGQVTADGTRLVVTSGSISAASPDDSLTPSRWDAALGCYGSELHVRAGLQIPGGAVELMSLGWLRIDTYDTVEAWQQYTASNGDLLWAPRGAQVPVQCSDRMSLLDDARFLAPEQPASLTSVITEITRLCQGLVPVADLSSVTDAAIPKSISYDQSRTGAIQALAGLLGCTARMDPDGALTLVPTVPTGSPVWTVTVSGDPGQPPLASWARKGDRAGLYNAVVSSGQDASGNPIQAIATENAGPLRYDGPLGRIPYFHSSPLITTQAACQADATTTLTNLIAQRTVTIPVTVPFNPALETFDVITVELPDRTLTGPVQTIAWPLGVGAMTVNVAVPRSSLWDIA